MNDMEDFDPFEGLEVTEEHPASQFSPIPQDAILRLVQKGVITLPPEPEHLPIIEALKEVWGDEWYMRNMLTKVRSRDREMMVYFPMLGKVEKYILKIYLNKEVDGKRIEVSQVQEMIFKAFKARRTKEQIVKIRNLAKRYKGGHETSAKREKILVQGFKI